jgi:hypothetical protein
MPNVYFVSGHPDVTNEEWNEYYKPALEKAVAEPDARFVVGDARGVDSLAQGFLRPYAERVRVFHLHKFPRTCSGPFERVGGFTRDTERDITMTRSSTHDIALVREGREDSGVARNIARRSKPVKANRYGVESKA